MTGRQAEIVAWQAIRWLALESDDRRAEVSRELDMSFVKAKALRYLLSGPLTMGQLTAELRSDPPYTSLVVDDLVARDFVRRLPHPMDRRRKLVQLTEIGAGAAARAEQILDRPAAELADLDDEEVTELARLLVKISPSRAGLHPPRTEAPGG